MEKLKNLLPVKNIQKEDLEDMEVLIPSQIKRFMERVTKALKSLNLSRPKEQYIIAKLVDALGMSPSDLQQAVQKLKRNKIVKR